MTSPLVARAFAAVPRSEWAGGPAFTFTLDAALRDAESMEEPAPSRGVRHYDERGALLAETATEAAALLGCHRAALRDHTTPYRDGVRLISRPTLTGAAGGRAGRTRSKASIDKARATRKRNALARIRAAMGVA